MLLLTNYSFLYIFFYVHEDHSKHSADIIKIKNKIFIVAQRKFSRGYCAT